MYISFQNEFGVFLRVHYYDKISYDKVNGGIKYN